MDARRTSDPYAVVSSEGEPVGRTKRAQRTLNPVCRRATRAALLGSERVLVALYDHAPAHAPPHPRDPDPRRSSGECPAPNPSRPSARTGFAWVLLLRLRDGGRRAVARAAEQRFAPGRPRAPPRWVVGAVGLEAADMAARRERPVRRPR